MHSTLSSFRLFSLQATGRRLKAEGSVGSSFSVLWPGCSGVYDSESVSTEFTDLSRVHVLFGKGFKCVLTDGGVCLTCVVTLCCRQTLISSYRITFLASMCTTRTKIFVNSSDYSSSGNKTAGTIKA